MGKSAYLGAGGDRPEWLSYYQRVIDQRLGEMSKWDNFG